MNWYLKKNDDEVYGPIETDTLYRWAAEGRIAADDQVSEDKKSWKFAHILTELYMDWFVKLPDGSNYGPVHLMAFMELIEEGTVDLNATIINKDTSEKYVLGEALYAALRNQNIHLRSSLDDMATQLAAAQSSSEPVSAAPAADRQELKHLREKAMQGDINEREARKWKKMYEEELESGKRVEQELKDKVREYKNNDLANQHTLEQQRLKLKQLERDHAQLQRAVADGSKDDVGEAAKASAELMAVMKSYNELSDNFDTLMNQLKSKSEEIHAIIESREQIQKHAEERIRQMEEIMQREQEEADLARKRLAELEETHFDLVKSYRDMNDRLIRMNQKT